MIILQTSNDMSKITTTCTCNEDRFEEDVLALAEKVDDMVVTNDGFKKAFTNVTIDITDLKNDQSKTSKTVLGTTSTV